MSIIYNNQVVAGKYTQQVVADADTVNAGIIKLATEEQVIEGVDNTTAVTPFYLAQKQDKISAGDGIVIDNNEISCTINPDEQTIVRKDNGTMQCIGQLTKSNTLKFDWEGTQAEYNVAYLNGTIQPDWYCYITDDEEFVDYADVCNQSLSNLKPEGEARFTAKANTDLDNLSSVGQGKLDIKADKATTLNGYGITDGLNKNQITNCLLEVPQRIKLELNNGTLTLKAGSVVIVPNGFEEDGVTPKFDYVTVENDLTTIGWANFTGMVFAKSNERLDFTTNAQITSGNSATLSSGNVWYDTVTNTVKRCNDGSTWTSGYSFPICLATSNGSSTTSESPFSSLDQIFNGMGYIGSTAWLDKGVKGLIPNGINEDGSLRNIEVVTSKIDILNLPDFMAGRQYAPLVLNNTGSIRASLDIASSRYYEVKNKSDIRIEDYSFWYVSSENKCYYLDGTFQIYERPLVYIGYISVNDPLQIASLNNKPPFRAVDYNDFNTLNADFNTLNNNALLDSDKATITTWALPSTKRTDLTLGASGTTYTAPANGWFFLQKSAKSNNQYVFMSNNYTQMRAGLNMMANHTCYLSLPALKGETVTISYDATGDTGAFFFVYAKGDQ